MSSQIIGNLIGAAVLGTNNTVDFFFIMGGVGFFASFLFLFLKKPFPTEKRMGSLNKDDSDTNDLMMSSNEPSRDVIHIENKKGVVQDIKSVWYLLISKRMISFLP